MLNPHDFYPLDLLGQPNLAQVYKFSLPHKPEKWISSSRICDFIRFDSLRSKRFHFVSEQRKTGFGRARNETRAKK